MRLRLLLPAVLVVLLVLTSAQNVFAEVLDQSQESVAGFENIKDDNPCGQEFLPSLPALLRVEVRIGTDRPGHGDDTITLTIRQGTIDGPVLATASVPLKDGFDGWVSFALGSVSVTPGAIHVIRLTATKDTFGWGGNIGNPYAKGRFIRFGNPQAPGDAAFRTYGASYVGGVVVPTNTLTVLAPYLAVIGLVATAALAAKKRRN